MAMAGIKELLRTSSKGQLHYDRTWESEGRVQEIIDDVRNQLLTLSVCPKEDDTEVDSSKEIIVRPSKSDHVNPAQVLEALTMYEEERLEEVEARAAAYASGVSEYLMEVEEETENEIIEIRRKHYEAVIDRLNEYQNEYRRMMSEVLGRLSIVHEESASVKLKEIENKHKQQLQEKEQKHQDQIRNQLLSSKEAVESGVVNVQEFFTTHLLESQSYHTLIEDVQQKMFNFRNKIDALLSQKLTEDLVNEGKRIEVGCRSFVAEIPSRFEDILAEHKSRMEAKEKEKKKEIEAKAVSVPEVKNIPPSKISFLKEYLNQQTVLKEFENGLKEFIDDTRMKPYRLNLQQFIRTNINAISTGSDDHLKQKYRNLCQLFDGRCISFQDKIIKATDHPKAVDFCMSFAAKTFISVGSKQVVSVAKAAFPMAAVIVLLWGKHPTFGYLFHAMIQEKCPFIGVFYPEREKDESETSHLIASGYVFGPDGQTLESEESYLNRMRALVRIYAAIVASNMGQDHPHGIDRGWIWLARTCSVQPIPSVSAAVIHAFLSACFFRLQKVYGIQAVKLLLFISSTYIPMIEKATGPDVKKQSIVQLTMFVDETMKKLKKNSSLKPEGFLPDYFWQKSFLNS